MHRLMNFGFLNRPALLAPLFALAILPPARAGEALARREWTVDGVAREALLHVPANAASNAAPVVFVFHGHGGAMGQAARSFGLHALWPEAIVVYPQGLNTAGRLTDPLGKKPGWQHGAGAEGDRDLKFFDAMLESLRHDYRVDEKRIFATGHSNGGGFTYLLWAQRGDRFAAFAPSAAASADALGKLKPKPMLHIAGNQDPLVKFAWQQATIDAVRKSNGCGEGQPWGKNLTKYPSTNGTPVVTLIFPGGHQFPPEAPAAIVKFFKEQGTERK